MIAVLFSGGIDSLIHLCWAMDVFGKNKVQPVYFDAGQDYAARELPAARDVCSRLGLTLREVKLETLPMDKVTGQVELRNLLFILQTALFEDCTGVVFGMLKAEAPVDKNPKFVKRVQTLIDSQFAPSAYREKRKPFRVYTPFQGMTKTQMIRWYLKQHDNEGLLYRTVACYRPQGFMCGECISCFNRWLAFDRCGLNPEFYDMNPANAMLERLGAMRKDKQHKSWSAVGLLKAWKRRQWLWETYCALNAYTKASWGKNVLRVVFR